MSACRYEHEVTRAAREDRWTDALRAHVAECEDCRAALDVAPWMDRFAATDEREHILPDPAVVWLKAQLLRGTAVADRIVRPMTRFQALAYLIVAACWAALVTWKFPTLLGFVDSEPSSLVHRFAATSAGALTTQLFVFVLVLTTITAALALYTILAEE